MFEYGIVVLFSGIVTLTALDHYLPKTEPTSSHPLLPFIGLYGISATGAPVFAYLAQVVPIQGTFSYALYLTIGTIVMILPLFIIEQRARVKRRNHPPLSGSRAESWAFWNRQ
jgi:hypothetical protein